MIEFDETLDTAFLAMRPGEQFVFTNTPPDNDHYAVMLLETPDFPGNDGHVESKPLAVLCAIQHLAVHSESRAARWGWVHVEANTKEIIGRGLDAMNATYNVWHYMEIKRT